MISVIDLRAPNLKAIVCALTRLGIDHEIGDDVTFVEDADAILLPWDGSLAAGLDLLDETGLGVAIQEAAATGALVAGINSGGFLLGTRIQIDPDLGSPPDPAAESDTRFHQAGVSREGNGEQPGEGEYGREPFVRHGLGLIPASVLLVDETPDTPGRMLLGWLPLVARVETPLARELTSAHLYAQQTHLFVPDGPGARLLIEADLETGPVPLVIGADPNVLALTFKVGRSGQAGLRVLHLVGDWLDGHRQLGASYVSDRRPVVRPLPPPDRDAGASVPTG